MIEILLSFVDLFENFNEKPTKKKFRKKTLK
jgi:hypothetical protein